MPDSDSNDMRPGDFVVVSKGALRDTEGVIDKIEEGGVWVMLRLKLDPSFIQKTAVSHSISLVNQAANITASGNISRSFPATAPTSAGQVVPPSNDLKGKAILILPGPNSRFTVEKLATFTRVAGTSYFAKIKLPGNQCVEIEFPSTDNRIQTTDEPRPCDL